MAWSLEGTKLYLSEFGLKPVLSRIGTMEGDIYLSNTCQVDPNNMNDSNQYAYYIYSQENQAKALLVTTSICDSKYVPVAEAKFKKLISSLIKQTTTGNISKNFTLENDNAEQIEDVVIQIERDTKEHKNSLRGILSIKENSASAKEWMRVIKDAHLAE